MNSTELKFDHVWEDYSIIMTHAGTNSGITTSAWYGEHALSNTCIYERVFYVIPKIETRVEYFFMADPSRSGGGI